MEKDWRDVLKSSSEGLGWKVHIRMGGPKVLVETVLEMVKQMKGKLYDLYHGLQNEFILNNVQKIN